MLLEVLNKMSKKTHSLDSNCSGNCKCDCIEWKEEEMLQAYREAAAADDFLFGDDDYSYLWLEENAKE